MKKLNIYPHNPENHNYYYHTSNLIIVSKEMASQLLLRNTHLHTFNSDCRTINDYDIYFVQTTHINIYVLYSVQYCITSII